MNTPLAAYHDFVDALVSRRPCVIANRFQGGQRWPDSSGLAQFNSLMESLSPELRLEVAAMLQLARDGGIHDVLVELSERTVANGMRLYQSGIELPIEPHGTELYFDWTARCAGEAWPHEG